MEMTNIFRIATSDLGPEDKFTAFLHYLVLNIPSIGQGMVDIICQRSGLAPAIFETAVDHPAGDVENKPDFMLSCKELDILCEHKLNSDLGCHQLERYLGLPKNRPTYLILITNRSHNISAEVLQSNSYLRPKDSSTPFFYWEDFYPIIANHGERLAQDFVKYMRDLGMAPSPLAEEWGQLFLRRDVAEKFYEATMDMRSYFSQQLGAQCQADPSRLGFQVKHPRNWLHLLYFYVARVAQPAVVGIEPPYLIARVFVQEVELGRMRNLVSNNIQTEDGLILGRLSNEMAAWDKNLVMCYECISSLENYLTENSVETRAKLQRFGQAVFEHVDTVCNTL